VIRLLIAAPSPAMRLGLSTLLGSVPGVEVVGAYADLSAVDDLAPDVVLAVLPADEIMPPARGAAPAYVLIGNSRPGWTQEALRLGVRAILSPDASPSAIVAAIDAAANGLAAIDPHELEDVLTTAGSPPVRGETPELTARERDVLSLMAEGMANKTIAWKRNISEHTVKFHVASILAKLNAASRTEAVTIGIRKGLVLL